jgi:hypothetical protein
MPGYKWKKKALLAKIETVAGTDSVPTGAANAILGMNVELNPLAAEAVRRALELPFYGSQGQILVGQHQTLSFEVEVAGAGAAGTVPAYGALLRGCGLSETITASTKVDYKPISDAQESLSIYLYVAGTLHKLLCGRGSFTMGLNARGLPVFRFSFLGLLVAAATGVPPALTVTAWKTPVPVGKTNTPTFTVHALACVAQSFNFDLGNDVQGRFLIGQESIEVVDRLPSAEAVIESPDITVKDFFAIATNRTRAAISIVHGIVAGNIVQFDAALTEIGAPQYSVDQGIAMMTLPMEFVPSGAGNDEFTLTVK